jgi:CBS domain-containing protein
LASDQDNALAYADSDDPTVDAYFEKVASQVNDGLARCGCTLDNSDVLARSKLWRKSLSQWKAVFEDCLAYPGDSNLVRAVIAFDFRKVTGELDVERPLVEILRDAPEHPGFIARLARTVTELRSPLGFRQRLIGPVDVKKSAALPIENLARFYGLANRVTVSGTLDRLAAVEGLGAVSSETATSLQEAFTIIWNFRLQHHAAAVAAGLKPDNIVDADRLPPLAHLDLQAALRAVAAAQKPLSIYSRQFR